MCYAGCSEPGCPASGHAGSSVSPQNLTAPSTPISPWPPCSPYRISTYSTLANWDRDLSPPSSSNPPVANFSPAVQTYHVPTVNPRDTLITPDPTLLRVPAGLPTSPSQPDFAPSPAPAPAPVPDADPSPLDQPNDELELSSSSALEFSSTLGYTEIFELPLSPGVPLPAGLSPSPLKFLPELPREDIDQHQVGESHQEEPYEPEYPPFFEGDLVPVAGLQPAVAPGLATGEEISGSVNSGLDPVAIQQLVDMLLSTTAPQHYPAFAPQYLPFAPQSFPYAPTPMPNYGNVPELSLTQPTPQMPFVYATGSSLGLEGHGIPPANVEESYPITQHPTPAPAWSQEAGPSHPPSSQNEDPGSSGSRRSSKAKAKGQSKGKGKARANPPPSLTIQPGQSHFPSPLTARGSSSFGHPTPQVPSFPPTPSYALTPNSATSPASVGVPVELWLRMERGGLLGTMSAPMSDAHTFDDAPTPQYSSALHSSTELPLVEGGLFPSPRQVRSFSVPEIPPMSGPSSAGPLKPRHTAAEKGEPSSSRKRKREGDHDPEEVHPPPPTPVKSNGGRGPGRPPNLYHPECCNKPPKVHHKRHLVYDCRNSKANREIFKRLGIKFDEPVCEWCGVEIGRPDNLKRHQKKCRQKPFDFDGKSGSGPSGSGPSGSSPSKDDGRQNKRRRKD